jgi:cobalt-zinc-cadmium efflux system protein
MSGAHDHHGHDHAAHAHRDVHGSAHGDAHGHGHAHDHGHHGHGHHHAPTDFGRAFALGIGLNLAFVVAEAVFGVLSGSLALLADAGHNLSDVLGLALAWAASILGRRAPSSRFTYGLRGSSILAAVANALLLAVACGAIAWEAIGRFGTPHEVKSTTVIAVAAVGIVVNGLTALLFMRGRHDDLNVRGAYLHMVADAAVSFGVVVTGVVMLFTDWRWLDPLVSLVIVVVILVGTWGLFRDSMQLALAGVPRSIDLGAVRAFLRARAGVVDVHDLHIWAMSTTEVALTAHLVMPEGSAGDAFLGELCRDLEHRFGIHHATVQVERGDGAHPCKLAPDHVV